MDPFQICVAALPLAAYLLLLGLINLFRRPFLTSGARDLAALGVGVSGLMTVGPLELFMSEAAAARFGQYVWLLLIAGYGLGVTFLVLLARPRLVIYNLTPEQLRPVLARIVTELDREARWAGDGLFLPALGVQLHLESYPIMRHISLISSGHEQSLSGWQRLEQALAAALGSVRVDPNPRAGGLIAVGVAVLAASLAHMLAHPAAVGEGFRHMLRL